MKREAVFFVVIAVFVTFGFFASSVSAEEARCQIEELEGQNTPYYLDCNFPSGNIARWYIGDIAAIEQRPVS